MSETERECPECFAHTDHALKGTVYTCECGNEWDIAVPLTEEPAGDTLRDWVLGLGDFGETTDGCTAYEPDGRCCHGYPAWARQLGY